MTAITLYLHDGCGCVFTAIPRSTHSGLASVHTFTFPFKQPLKTSSVGTNRLLAGYFVDNLLLIGTL